MLSIPSLRFRVLRGIRSGTSLAALFLLAVSGCPIQAETLKEALTAAYLYNPTLKAARAQLRATDNGVSQAKSGYRPTISATLQDGFQDVRSRFDRTTPGF